MKRSAGRPKRDSDVAAKAKVIVAAQQALRTHQIGPGLPRGEIAQHAGVSPATVTYYFRDDPSLIEAAATPLIDCYLEELSLLTGASSLEPLEKFYRLVAFLIRIARVDGQLIERYVKNCKQMDDPSSNLVIKKAVGLMSGLFADFVTCGFFRQHDVAFVLTMIWGSCSIIAQSLELSSLSFSNEVSITERERRQAETLVGVLIHGLKASV